MTDITSLEKENQELRDQLIKIENKLKQLTSIKQQLETVVTNVPVVLWVLDKEGIFTLSEGAGLTELGLEPGQVVGLSVFDVYADFPDIISSHKRAYAGEDTNYSFKMEGMQNVEGISKIEDVHYDARVRPFYGDKGEISGIIGIAYNTTSIKRAEKRIAANEMRYRTLINASPLGVLVLQQGICKFANPAFLEMFSYDAEELIDFPAAELLAHEVREELQERTIRREKGEKVLTSYESLGMKKDGTTFHIQVDTSMIIFNEIPSVLIFFKDISNEIKLSKEKDRLQEQLLLSQKLESLGVVAGGVAHDFNNLLVGIMGNASLLESRVIHDKEASIFVEEIQEISREAANLTKQMLAYTGKSTRNQISTNLNDVLNDISKLITLSVSKSITVKYELSSSLDIIIADVSQIKQIILNLVINASEAIGDKNGVISIITGTQNIDEIYKSQLFPVFDLVAGFYSYIEITDNGCGMEKDKIANIFDPFYSTKFTGRGLGLSVVQGIVKAHNGAIRVYSEIDQGTTFKVLFPISDEIRLTNMESEQVSVSLDQTGVVLFCDDDLNVRKVGANMLSYLGFTTKLATNGLEAIEYFEEMKDDIVLIILDLTMPIMTGKETLSKIRLISEDIPVIISSGYNEIEVVDKFRGRSNISFLQKPYSLSDFKSAIINHLSKNSE